MLRRRISDDFDKKLRMSHKTILTNTKCIERLFFTHTDASTSSGSFMCSSSKRNFVTVSSKKPLHLAFNFIKNLFHHENTMSTKESKADKAHTKYKKDIYTTIL